jgi:hypothetical protein
MRSATIALDFEGSIVLFFNALHTTGANLDDLNFLTA